MNTILFWKMERYVGCFELGVVIFCCFIVDYDLSFRASSVLFIQSVLGLEECRGCIREAYTLKK